MTEKQSAPLYTIGFVITLVVIHMFQWTGMIDTDRFSLSIEELKSNTLLAYALLHGNPLHLLANVTFAIIFGIPIERRFGGVFFAILFALSAWFAGIGWYFSTDMDSNPLVGAAAAITAMGVCYAFLSESHLNTLGLFLLWIMTQVFMASVDGFETTPPAIHFIGALIGLIAIAAGNIFIPEAGAIYQGKNDRDERQRPRGHAKDIDGNSQGRSRKMAPVELSDRAGQSRVSQTEPSRRRTTIDQEAIEINPQDEKASLDAVGTIVRPDRGENELKREILNDPENVDANYELACVYILKKRSADATLQGRRAIQVLLDHEDYGRAFELFANIHDKFGGVELGPQIIIRLAENRLDLGEVAASQLLISMLMKVESTNRMIPGLLGRYVVLLALHRGPEARETRQWVQYLTDQYTAHPATKKALESLKNNQSNIEKEMIELSPSVAAQQKAIDQEEITYERIKNLLNNGNYRQAADMLIDNEPLISEYDPLILFSVVEKLATKDSTLPRGVMLMELTVRAHLDHPNTPNLIVELITLYLSRLHKPERAYQWRNYMQNRWPDSNSTKKATDLIKK